MFNPLNIFSKLIKSGNEKELGRIQQIVKKVNILEKDLGHKVDSPKISQAQISLILKDLDKVDGFYDKWWRTESSQLESFITVVQNRRPDLSKRFIIDAVTRTLNG